jgi:endonuclease/exonuclease/phosphatase family metal-dependent hydrolase
MTYNVHGFRGSDGRYDPDRIADVLADNCVDVIALQEAVSDIGVDPLGAIALRLGMQLHYGLGARETAFLSTLPLRGVRETDLGYGGWCLQADLDHRGKRLHLFNLQLSFTPTRRRVQFGTLLSSDVLGNPSLVCPTLVLGDFADPLWWFSSFCLDRNLFQAPRPVLGATYPAPFPLLSRDRAYMRGDIRVLETRVIRSAAARKASSHLPVQLKVQVMDPGSYLLLKDTGGRMEAAPG